MNDSEINRLQSEVTRLNRIISVLLEQNEHLKNENNLLRNGKASPDLSYSVAENINGTTDDSNSVEEKENGITEHSYSITENGNGTTEQRSSIAEKMNGTTGHSYSVAENSRGITEERNSLPVTITIDSQNIVKLSLKLRSNGFPKVSSQGRRNTATLLLHFYNKGRGDHTTLRKLTELSKGGLAKLIMSLKKRGLIHRTAYREFGVSAGGMQLLHLAFLEKAKA